MKKNIWKRLLSLALALVMVVGLLPMTAYADVWVNASAVNALCDTYKNCIYLTELTKDGVDKLPYVDYVDITGCTRNGNKVTFKFRCQKKRNSEGITITGSFTITDTDCSQAVNTTVTDESYGIKATFRINRSAKSHTGGTATCVAKAKCSACGKEYGDYGDHSWSDWTTSNGRHIRTCTLNTTHTESGNCDHKPATCLAASACSVCKKEYAPKLEHNYIYTADGSVLTETCNNGCGHSKTATLQLKSDADLTYTGSPITPMEMVYPEGWVGEQKQPTSTDYTNNVNAGTDTASCSFAHTDGVTVEKNFSIEPASLSDCTVTMTPESGIFNGELHSKPSYTLTYNGKQLVKDIDYIVDANWSGDFTNVGSCNLTLKGNGNFTGTKTLTYTIHKATPTFTAPAAKELTYNGQPLALVEAGSVNPGKLLYRLDGGEYSETVPTATNAGNYTVYYKVVDLDTDNYNEISSGSVSATIRKAEAPDITFPTVLNAITYGQKLEEAKLSSYANDYGTFSWNAPTSVPNAGNAGYALDFYPNELALQNYDWKNVGEAQWIADRNALCICPSVTVNKAAAAITTVPTPNDLTYNGEDQPLVTAGSVTGGTMVYSLEKEGTYIADLPKAMDAGTYTVWYKVDADSNHTDSEPASVTVEIKKADASVDAAPTANNGLVYNGREQYLITSTYSMGGTVLYSLDGVNYTESLPKGINAQEYTVYYKVVGDANHNDMEPKTVTATIAPWNIGTASCKAGVWGGPFTYNGQEHTPTPQIDAWVDDYPVPGNPYAPGADVRLTEGTDYTVTYSDNVNAGQAVVTFTGKGNYTGTITREFTIAPKPITVTIADKTSVYGEAVAELTATTDGIVNNDTNVYSLATTATGTANAGTYPITGTALDTNYAITFVDGTYTITKAPVNSIGTDKTVDYTAGMEVDLSQMFSIDENAGAVDYWITHLTGEGSFTSAPYLYRIDKAGTFTVKITTKETANYKSGEATAVLTVNPGDPGIGAVTAGVVNDTLETSAIVLTRADTTVPGTLTVDAEQTLAWGDNTIRYTFTPNDTTNYKVVKGEVAVTVVDTIAPTGTVTVSTNSWAEFLNNIKFGLFFKETQTVSVVVSDNLSGVAKIEYIESKTALDLEVVKAATQWTEMKNGSVSVTLEDTKQFIYYIRITDKAGNITYLSSDGAEYDTAAPVIAGVDNGATYYTTQNVTVTDKNIDTITLNGKAATGSITLEGNKEATYTIVATDKAGNSTTVTVTMKPIKALAEATDDLTHDNVTSADAPALEALVEKLDELLADEDVSDDGEKETLEQHKTVAESLLHTIEENAAEQKAVTDKAAEYDEDAVKSTDKAGLEELEEDIDTLLDTDNLTQDERADLEALLKDVEDMIATINDVAADSKTATDAVASCDPATVTSKDKAAIESALETIEDLLDTKHLTDTERDALEDAKADAEALLDAIDEAAKAADTDNTAKVEDVTTNNVTPDDKSDLEKAKTDLEDALTDNGGNYTEEEKKTIQDKIQRIEDSLEIIGNVEAAEDIISDLPATVEPDDEETVTKIEEAKKAYDELTDYEKSLVDEKVKEKLDKLTAAAVAYDIVKGDGGKWSEGTASGLSFTANGAYSKFSGILVDNKVVDPKHYTAESGSTIVTLKASYLDTLSTGKHTLTVVYTDGETSCEFSIAAKSTTPATGDDSDIMLYGSMFTVSLAAIIVLLLASKKRKQVS